jgi:hypothetical protein
MGVEVDNTDGTISTGDTAEERKSDSVVTAESNEAR